MRFYRIILDHDNLRLKFHDRQTLDFVKMLRDIELHNLESVQFHSIHSNPAIMSDFVNKNLVNEVK